MSLLDFIKNRKNTGKEQSPMYIIVGLGNPGKKYDGTRHNVGFDAIDILAERNQISLTEAKHKGICGKGFIEGQRVVLAKPLTFMNLSGETVASLINFYKIEEDQLIVLYDDISLEPGQIRIRKKGSAGGHNGMKSIIAHVGSQEFSRVRIGVGEKPPGYDLADYVLGHFKKEEQKRVDDALMRAAWAVEKMIAGGVDEAMNLYNKKVEF